ncbi:hypothetical protein [Frondihabitans australicus]|uniref:IclR-like helix-turn-helix domain-containing protein n=1 Tax=Frondihabitans australicus TaxID=386892 RepID=A0A495IGM6_9MICO|nr:hypothetical protein [Frondihabitans australicus]RKR75152.1 hypothetical protein C8E83_2290 [Frondihabitans australicus]
MFHVMRNSPFYGTSDLIDRFMTSLRTLFPLGVLNRVSAPAYDDGSIDAYVEWQVAETVVRLELDVKLGVLRPDGVRDAFVTPGSVPVVISPFLAPATQEALARAGWSYWDPTGNILIVSSHPPLAVQRTGATRDPDRAATDPRPLKSLKGETTSEVMVGLLANRGATSLRDFARDRRLPVSSVSRVISLLRYENLLTPTGGGPIVLRDRRLCAERWTEDYGFASTFSPRRYFSLGGRESVIDRLRRSDVDYAVTGVSAGQAWFAEKGSPGRLAPSEIWIYTNDLEAVERAADLAPDQRQGDVLVAHSEFLNREHSFSWDGVSYVTPWRIVGDLLSTRGRSAALGADLLDDLVTGDSDAQR